MSNEICNKRLKMHKFDYKIHFDNTLYKNKCVKYLYLPKNNHPFQ